MNLRNFHQLDNHEATGLEVFYNWSKSPKKPIKETDISLIYNGKEHYDTEVDYIAFGNAVVPCLTSDNLTSILKSLSEKEKSELKESLGWVSKEEIIEWLKTEEASRIIESLGFKK